MNDINARRPLPLPPEPTDPDAKPLDNAPANVMPIVDGAVITGAATMATAAPATAAHKPWFKRHWKWLVPVAAVALIGGGAGVWALSREPETTPVAAATPEATATPVPTPVTTAAPLTGLQVEPAAAKRPIYAIMVENLAGKGGARPQSGLSQAGVVYEALAEGGITRFLAVFGDDQPKSIGPVRSLRPYYIDWAMEFGAALAHAGGSSDALSLASSLKIKDLNALGIGAPTFYRTPDRLAPHNLYTSAELMGALLTGKSFDQEPAFKPNPRKVDAPSASPAHPKIHIDFSTADYAVDYAYDPTANAYVRSNGGVAHIDKRTGQPINVKNVVIEYMPVTYTAAPHDSQYINMPTVGSGKALVFRDGNAMEATWSKASRGDRTKLLDADGKEIPLNAGNTWFEIVPSGRTVTY